MATEPKPSTGIERLSFDQLTPTLQGALRARVERLGYLGEFFQCSAHQPEILTAFIAMTEALKKALPDRLTEVGALTVACAMNNGYERHQHERLSRKLGFGESWVAMVERLDPDTAEGMCEGERVVQRLVLAVVQRKGKDVGSELSATIRVIGPDAAIAILFLIGRYVTHAMIVNALDLAPPVQSIFDEAARP